MKNKNIHPLAVGFTVLCAMLVLSAFLAYEMPEKIIASRLLQNDAYGGGGGGSGDTGNPSFGSDDCRFVFTSQETFQEACDSSILHTSCYFGRTRVRYSYYEEASCTGDIKYTDERTLFGECDWVPDSAGISECKEGNFETHTVASYALCCKP